MEAEGNMALQVFLANSKLLEMEKKMKRYDEKADVDDGDRERD